MIFLKVIHELMPEDENPEIPTPKQCSFYHPMLSNLNENQNTYLYGYKLISIFISQKRRLLREITL